MKFFIRLVLFLIINFSALGIGIILMNDGPNASWYVGLEKAPWTPPGWFFGFAWTTIMICFSIYMAKLFEVKNKQLIFILFAIQFVLNVSWNYLFFNQHLVTMGMINLVILLMTVSFIAFNFKSELKKFTLFIIPYIIWLVVANSLNGYILFNN
ncbi:TspO/MBR family protein [uncultured Kordia sp.]|uniref:TspO/MBR family protein n=1 Tax=uncultured Kordia sp. TaxID=507699 RepID=UPI002632D52F|nr:TspO/MBR family protein [uncultured Kordia sp.]